MKDMQTYLPGLLLDSAVFGLSGVGGGVMMDFSSLYSLAMSQGVVAIAWDDIQRAMAAGEIEAEQQPSKGVKLQWALAAEQVERKYLRQVQVIEKLARFFAEHNIKMMILKGYGLSLNYPVPNHRPCSDVDIWLFEEAQMPDGSIQRRSAQQRADKLLREHLNIAIDEDKHHHTVFYVDGVMVENHYDFLNIHSHHSNRIIEQRLQQLTQQPMAQVAVGEATAYLPSADFHSLFMMRHSASHFAAERVVVRHLLDWKYFIEKHTREIDWDALKQIAEQTNMRRFLDCTNAICIDKLGLSAECVPPFEREAKLVERVWGEILQPEFSEPQPKGAGYLKSWSYMFRRWWANRWKHRIVYNEGLLRTFFVQVYSHLLKPKSLKL
ncbi:MAG: nucleotidyltransferase family protein [Alistipes sp.]|nr:nucleotidyltransferase family protein [Alistipes sp.]